MMMTVQFDPPRRLAAEFFGTCILVTAVVGSGIMADKLTDDVAVALLCNTIATGAILFVLITILAPVSGAHLNPAVTAVFAYRRQIPSQMTIGYIAVQVAGAITGTGLAHLMFEQGGFVSTTVRSGGGQWLSEAVATFGLIAVVLAGSRFAASALPALVGFYITSAYWFTASTSFANPAVAIARSLTNTFSGIRPQDLPGFLIAEFAGAFIASAGVGWLLSIANDSSRAIAERAPDEGKYSALTKKVNEAE
jgi:glycerol uptake facilitator-like aquaporin